jgi:hypothetical protein
MLIIQLVLSKNEGLNSVEGVGIQSRKVEPTLIPYVTTPVVTTTRQRTFNDTIVDARKDYLNHPCYYNKTPVRVVNPSIKEKSYARISMQNL